MDIHSNTPQVASSHLASIGKSDIHVVYVIARLNVGGTARYVQQLVSQTSALGIRSTVLTGHVQGGEQEDPCAIDPSMNIVRIPHLGRAINPRNDIKARLEIRKVIRALQPDLIHTHTFKAGALTRSVRSRRQAPMVHTFHGHLFDDPEFTGIKARAIEAIERALAKRTTQLVTVGELVRRDLDKRGITAQRPTVSIAPGVRRPEDTDQREARRNLNDKHGLSISETEVVVAWMARVTGVKNPQRALAVATDFPEATFLIAGGGDLEEDTRRQAPKNVHVIGWADASDVLGAADIVLSTSDNEGMPVALIEAQMLGLPVVATDVGSVSEVVLNKQTGFVTRPSARELTKALTELIYDDELRSQMGQAARRRANELFTPQALAGAHADLYRDLLATRV